MTSIVGSAVKRGGGMPTRRTLIKLAGGLAAAGFAPRQALASEGEEIGPATLALSNYMSEARERPLPPHVLERAKHDLRVHDHFIVSRTGGSSFRELGLL